MDSDVPDFILKFNRARTHLVDLIDRVDTFRSKGGYGSVRQLEAAGSTHRYYLRLNQALPPEIPLIIGDCLHNARSSLDQLVFLIAQQRRPTMSKDEESRTQFVIADSQQNFESQKRRRETAMGTELLDQMESLQPYKGWEHRFLRYLRDLSDIDKHRRLNIVTHVMNERAPGLFQMWAAASPREMKWQSAPLRDGALILSAFFAHPQPDLDLGEVMEFSIGIYETQVQALDLESGPALLGSIIDHIETVVFPALLEA